MNVVILSDTYLPDLSTESLEVVNTVSLLERRGNRVLVMVPSKRKESYEDDGVHYLSKNERNKVTDSLKERILNFKSEVVHSFSRSLDKLAEDIHVQCGIALVKTIVPTKEEIVADEVIVRSEEERKLLREYNLDILINVLPRAIDPLPFTSLHISKDRVVQFESENGMSEATKVFLAITPLEKEMAPQTLIRVFSAFHTAHPEIDAKLFILGEGSERTSLELQAHELHVPEFVVFPGYIKYEELPFYFSRSNLYISINRDKEEEMCLICDLMNKPYLIYSDDVVSPHTYKTEHGFVENASTLLSEEEVVSSHPEIPFQDGESYVSKLMEIYNNAKRKAW
ncbi:MAG: glycosyltransferase [Coprobacillus sp.]|nr:glycosyltransferase [Coprobacillus sp.]